MKEKSFSHIKIEKSKTEDIIDIIMYIIIKKTT